MPEGPTAEVVDIPELPDVPKDKIRGYFKIIHLNI